MSVMFILLFTTGSVGLPVLAASANASGTAHSVLVDKPNPSSEHRAKAKKKPRPKPPRHRQPQHQPAPPNPPSPPRPPQANTPPKNPIFNPPIKVTPPKRPPAVSGPRAPRPRPRPPVTSHQTPSNPFLFGTTRQQPERCATLPPKVVTKTVYVPRHEHTTDRVLYGAGLVTMGAVLLVALVLMLGYAYGKVTAIRSERRYIKSLLPDDE